MTASRNPDLLIDAFLAEGLTDLPDRTFDAVRGEIGGTRQRVVIGRWREPAAPTITRLAIAAAVVLAVGLAWGNIGLLTGPGQTQPTVGPTPTLTVVLINRTGPLAAGRYVLGPDRGSGLGPSVIVTIDADGWRAMSPSWIERPEVDPNFPAPAFAVQDVVNRYTDICTSDTAVSPAPGPGVDDLLAAITAQPGIAAGPITDITIDGFSGKVVDLRISREECPEGARPWTDAGFVLEPGAVVRLVVLDVAGSRLTMFALRPPRQPDTRMGEREPYPDSAPALDLLLESLDIQP